LEQALNGAARVRFRQCLFDHNLEFMVPVTALLVAPGDYGGPRHILRQRFTDRATPSAAGIRLSLSLTSTSRAAAASL